MARRIRIQKKKRSRRDLRQPDEQFKAGSVSQNHLQTEALTSKTAPLIQRQSIAAEIGQIQGNRHLKQVVALQRKGDPAKEGAIASMEAKEKLIEHLSNELQGKPPKPSNAGQRAIEGAAKRALETPTGQQIQKKVTRFLFSKKGMPMTIMLGTAGAAALIANNAEAPSIPIPLSDSLALTLDLDGPVTQPTRVMATFKLKF